ncbi:hypothetical protein ATN89_17620 [Comamonas thiooxydans]|nr:hypothetical protein ATN89_17620 [Comamonas thiooxydans]
MCSSCRGGTLEQQAVSILKAMAVCRWSVEFRDSPTVIFTGTYSQLLYAYSGRPITKVTCLER